MGAPIGVVEIHLQLEISAPRPSLLRHWARRNDFGIWGGGGGTRHWWIMGTSGLQYITGVGSGGGGGGGQWYVCAPPQLLTPHFYFPLELYVYITLTNNYLAFFIYQLIILWTISIN